MHLLLLLDERFEITAVSPDLAALLETDVGDLIGQDGWSLLDGESLARERPRVERELTMHGATTGTATFNGNGRRPPLTLAYATRQLVDGASNVYYSVTLVDADEDDRDLATVPPEPLMVLTRKDVAVMARCSLRTVDRSIGSGALETIGPPGRRRITVEAYHRWLTGAALAVLLALIMLGVVAAGCLFGVRGACQVLDELCEATPKVAAVPHHSERPRVRLDSLLPTRTREAAR